MVSGFWVKVMSRNLIWVDSGWSRFFPIKKYRGKSRRGKILVAPIVRPGQDPVQPEATCMCGHQQNKQHNCIVGLVETGNQFTCASFAYRLIFHPLYQQLHTPRNVIKTELFTVITKIVCRTQAKIMSVKRAHGCDRLFLTLEAHTRFMRTTTKSFRVRAGG